jgi:hypothetical protein
VLVELAYSFMLAPLVAIHPVVLVRHVAATSVAVEWSAFPTANLTI